MTEGQERNPEQSRGDLGKNRQEENKVSGTLVGRGGISRWAGRAVLPLAVSWAAAPLAICVHSPVEGKHCHAAP